MFYSCKQLRHNLKILLHKLVTFCNKKIRDTLVNMAETLFIMLSDIDIIYEILLHAEQLTKA